MDFPVPLQPKLLALAKTLDVRPEDIEEFFMRGSGHGGQKINKTSSAVHLRHRPTGVEVRMQKHREQSVNRKNAYKILLLKIEQEKKGKDSTLAKKAFKLRKQKLRRSRRAKEKMLQEKHRQSDLKASRHPVDGLLF